MKLKADAFANWQEVRVDEWQLVVEQVEVGHCTIYQSTYEPSDPAAFVSRYQHGGWWWNAGSGKSGVVASIEEAKGMAEAALVAEMNLRAELEWMRRQRQEAFDLLVDGDTFGAEESLKKIYPASPANEGATR